MFRFSVKCLCLKWGCQKHVEEVIEWEQSPPQSNKFEFGKKTQSSLKMNQPWSAHSQLQFKQGCWTAHGFTMVNCEICTRLSVLAIDAHYFSRTLDNLPVSIIALWHLICIFMFSHVLNTFLDEHRVCSMSVSKTSVFKNVFHGCPWKKILGSSCRLGPRPFQPSFNPSSAAASSGESWHEGQVHMCQADGHPFKV